MPTITILGPDSVDPYVAEVLRDNQVLTWVLADGLEWDPKTPQPIEFLPADSFYAKWPGTKPEPVGEKPIGGPDRRDYEADTKKEMSAGKFQFYHYRLSVRDSTTKRKIKIRVKRGKKWYDPDVVNEPRP
ncbi:MAG TPA: hypothetical protein VGQ76_21265 [Thermoanaerobaculia bacterium]|jgi:hypothetical protein|nr:hypothetical protein [Thermoanaerobaculia bacterium]